MNHRYAYCSKDQDLDQDQEEMSLTPLVGSLAEDKPLSANDTQTPHSFLSDSSLDGAFDALKEGEEEEEREGETHRSFLEAADELGGSFIQESPTGEEQNENHCEVGSHIKTESHMWDRDAEDQNEDLNKCELNLDITGLQRVKT